VPLVLELRTWAAPPRSVFGLAGHVVLVEEEQAGAVQDWLADVVSDMVGLDVDPDRTFESYGIDSLALITLARRLSVKSGLPISITDLYEHPTVNALLKSIAAPAPAPQARAKVLCLHGFRTNKELLALQLGPLLNGLPLDLVFVNATRPSTGAHDERIPASTATFEWWGVADEPYDVAWRKTDGMEETERALPEGPFDGVIGFSQGAALACLVPSKWCVCFSAVKPPRGFTSRPSLHVYDPQEQVADECVAVAKAFDAPLTILHDEGHVVAKSAQVREQLHAFLQAQL
jgi:acyl carrier protein